MKLKFSILAALIAVGCFVFVGLTAIAAENNPDEVIALSSAIRSALPEVFGETGFAAVAGFGVALVGGPTVPGPVSELSGDISLPPFGGAPPASPAGGGGGPPPLIPIHKIAPQGPVVGIVNPGPPVPTPIGPQHVPGPPIANPPEGTPKAKVAEPVSD